jgi:hypothetical protein
MFSIGIVTYEARFEKFFMPLLHSIKMTNPDVEVIVCINGNHNRPFDESYRSKMCQFLSNYNNVFPMFWTQFRSLSKLWNNILINSSNDNVLVLNDDVTIHDPNIWSYVDQAINLSRGQSFKINEMWSFVCLNRREINDAGWFDERLLGVGEEDGDMEFRLCEIKGTNKFPSVNGFPIVNHSSADGNQSNTRTHLGRYNTFNRDLIHQKYKIDQQGAIRGNTCGDGQPRLIVDPSPPQYLCEKFYWDNKGNL